MKALWWLTGPKNNIYQVRVTFRQKHNTSIEINSPTWYFKACFCLYLRNFIRHVVFFYPTSRRQYGRLSTNSSAPGWFSHIALRCFSAKGEKCFWTTYKERMLPMRDSHRLFLRSLMSKQFLSEAETIRTYKESCQVYGGRLISWSLNEVCQKLKIEL